MDKELIHARIDEIINHIDMATSDLENVSLDEFDETSLVGRAVTFSVEQICEHLTKLKKDLEVTYPSLPWEKARDMRIIIAHMYLSLDKEIVYGTVKNDLPPLKEELIQIKKTL